MSVIINSIKCEQKNKDREAHFAALNH